MSDLENDRPSWLPSKFESPEALANSYVELERKLGEKGQELYEASQELSTLREFASRTQPDLDGLTEEDLAAFNAAEPYARAVMDSVAETPQVQADRAMQEAATGLRERGSNFDVVAMLAQAQAQARAQVDQQFGQQIGAVPTDEQVAVSVADQAVSLMEQTHPHFDENAKQRIVDEIERSPAFGTLVDAAAATNDPATLATAMSGVLAAANDRANSANVNSMLHTMKVNAQSATGAGTRPSPMGGDEAEWSKIMSAKSSVWP